MKFATTLLVFCVASLLSLGMVILYSSSMGHPGGNWVSRQLVWCVLGLVACVLTATVDYRHLKKVSWLVWAVAFICLVAVLIPKFGMKINGARRWFNLGFASFQPSEIAKLAVIIFLAWYGEKYARQMNQFVKGLVIPGVFVALLMGLVFLEPDYGTTLLLASVTLVLLLLAGVRWAHIIPPALLGAVGIALAIWQNPVRLQRIMAFLHPEEYKMGKGYQTYQAMIALGSGGTTGLGLGNGRQKLGFVPEHQTDFIFSIIGEELGLIATIGVVLAFVILLFTGLYIAWKARDTFGFLLASGITFLISVQAFINIGVVTSALPNKGLPLPFISHGGSNLFIMLASIGLLLNVARHASASPVETEPGAFALTPNI